MKSLAHHKEALRLAIPNILSGLSVPLLSSVDTALMGRQDSAAYLGAVGLGGVLFNFIYWNFGFLRMGTTGLVAQAFGRDDTIEIAALPFRALIIALIGSACVLLLQVPLLNIGLSLIEGSQEAEALTRTYFSIRIWDAPATMILYVMMGWFFGMQDSIRPLIITIFINIVNLTSNIYFVQYQGLDVDGVAYGTLVAQYSGCAFAFILFIHKFKSIDLQFHRKAVQSFSKFKHFLNVNRDILLRTMMLLFVFGFFTAQSAADGDVTLAVNQIFIQFIFLVSYGVDGFAYAAESLTGKYFGAKNKIGLKKSITVCFFWGFILSALASIIYFLFGDQLLHVYTDQSDIIQAALPYLPWIVAFPIVSVACYIFDGIFIGITATKSLRNTMFISTVLFLLTWLLTRQYGNHGLWISLTLFVIMRGLFQWIWWKRNIPQTEASQ